MQLGDGAWGHLLRIHGRRENVSRYMMMKHSCSCQRMLRQKKNQPVPRKRIESNQMDRRLWKEEKERNTK